MIKNNIFISLFLLLPFLGFAQNALLKGEVRGEAGEWLADASVRIVPGNLVSSTNLKGEFSFQLLAQDYVVEVSHLGYETEKRKVSLKKGELLSLSISLKPLVDSLSEVSVNGERVNPDQVLDVSKAAQRALVISKEKIAMMGVRRLDEVLREQTGMAVLSDLGEGNRSIGLQMQGFSSEYIMVLLNGQPMGGRHGGNFDLSRISVLDVERIEVIKGASCSFYGSEALGGTINIVTRQDINAPKITLGYRGGSFNSHDRDLSFEMPFSSNNGKLFFSSNYYSTGGFNVNPFLSDPGSKTAPPYDSFTASLRSHLRYSSSSALGLVLRYSARNSVMERNYGALPTRDNLAESDLNLMPTLEYNSKSAHRFISRYYFSRYTSLQDVSLLYSAAILQQNNFTELVNKVEQQHNYRFRDLGLTLGSGAGVEYTALNLSDEVSGGGGMLNYFAFSQGNWNASSSLDLTLGFRYDGNNSFGGRINPSFGLRFQPSNVFGLNFSFGSGYKVPTFRQLDQRFTNVTQGYTVLGSRGLNQALAEMNAAGDIQQVWANAAVVGSLRPERSRSMNLELSLSPLRVLSFKLNGFYNRINDLIISQQIGIKKNGSQIFSWFNISSMYSKGLEANFSFLFAKGFTLSGGYQFLDMKDKSVVDSIRSNRGAFGFVRSESGIRKAAVSDYFGLLGRSRHMANLQLSYYYAPWRMQVSLRGNFRSKYGFLDTDNNGYIDPFDVYVHAYALVNASVQKKLFSGLELTLSAENMSNYTDYLMPAQGGRMVMAGLNWNFNPKNFKRNEKK